MKHCEIEIVETAKPIGSAHEYQTFSIRTERFFDAKEAHKWIKDRYTFQGRKRTCKRIEMFVDARGGDPVQCGWIYCFKDKDEGVWRQDWVSIQKVNYEYVL